MSVRNLKFVCAVAIAAMLPPGIVPVAAQSLKSVPREKTLVVAGNNRGSGAEFRSVGIANPYTPQQSVRSSLNVLFEPLFFYSTARGELIPWLATGHSFNPAFDELTVKIREGARWSDGVPFTAEDVAFTLNLLRDNGKGKNDLLFATAIAQDVAEAKATDTNTLVIRLNKPDPRFVTKYLASYMEQGLRWLPAHVFKGVENVAEFSFFDLAKGWPLTTSPYRLVRWTSTQAILDQRDSWWAAQTGFRPMPEVQRIFFVPHGTDDRAAQLLIKGEVDSTADLGVPLLQTVMEQNPKIITHTGDEPPLGYLTNWTNSIWFNNQAFGFDDRRVRRAVGFYVDRKPLLEVGYHGATTVAHTPLADFPALKPYTESVRNLAEQSAILKHDEARGDALMKEAGFAKDAEGFWAKDGKRITGEVHTFGVLVSISNLVVEQLRRNGFDLKAVFNKDSLQMMRSGASPLMVSGHNGSITDPFDTLDLFHSRWAAEPGKPAASPSHVSRFANKDYDAIVEEIGRLPPGDPKVAELFRRAMEILYREVPEIPLAQWYHHVPMSTAYWTNWPSAQNGGVEEASWYYTFGHVAYQLKAAR